MSDTTTTTTATTISYADVIQQMPEGAQDAYTLVREFEGTIPPGTPAPAIEMLRNVFVCGLMAAMGEINEQINHPTTCNGDPTRLINLINGLNISLDKYTSEAREALAEKIETARGARVIRIHQGH